MNRNFFRWPVFVLAASTCFTACNKKNGQGEGNEEEVITTLNLKLTPISGGAALQFSYDDPDGPGGAAPTISPVTLPANRQFNLEVELLDKTKTPVANITDEVEQEADKHRMYYVSGGNFNVSQLNNDASGLPLGTTGVLATGAAGSGTLRVVLRHYGGNPPNKAATDAVDSPKSSSDVDVTFTVTVQ